MEPAAPLFAKPDATITSPLGPMAEVPEDSNSEPEDIAVCNAFSVRIVTEPVFATELLPPRTVTEPPVRVAPSFARTRMFPPRVCPEPPNSRTEPPASDKLVELATSKSGPAVEAATPATIEMEPADAPVAVPEAITTLPVPPLPAAPE